MTDLHVHTEYSFDSDEKVENYIAAAIKRGDKYIGFADHCEHNMLEFDANFQLPDLVARAEFLDGSRSVYNGIKILGGVEFGFSDASVPYYKRVLRSTDLDYSIMSVHTVPTRGDCYYPAFFDGLDKRAAYSLYLDEVYKSVCADIDFQIVGHIGYIARYAPYDNKLLEYSEFSYEIDKILRTIIERGLALELNASVFGLSVPFVPTVGIVERYVELGGVNFTFGSDAHKVSNYAKGEQAVREFLLSLGIEHVLRYENKKPVKEPIR